jgi:ribosome-binding protein aMBF1 (putative translation factor)
MTVDERAEFDRGYRLAALQTAIGEQVRTPREAAGLRQCDLAAQVGTSPAAIARLEAGRVGATVTTLPWPTGSSLVLCVVDADRWPSPAG